MSKQNHATSARYSSAFPRALPALETHHFKVVHGVNIGESIIGLDDLLPDDIYQLQDDSLPQTLTLEIDDEAEIRIGDRGRHPLSGRAVRIEALLTFISQGGQASEILLLAVQGNERQSDHLFLVPLAPLQRLTDYCLVGVDQEGGYRRLAETALVSFTRGTHISLGSGEQRKVEDIGIGDLVLTRDNGPQALRWKGFSTSRAMGDFAPILIRKGALNNISDLVVSADHRLLFYIRNNRLGTGIAPLFARARHLVNGRDVVRLKGGYVDLFQLLFDRHEIVYSEGIATESTPIDNHIKEALGQNAAGLEELIETHAQHPSQHREISAELLNRPDAVDLLREAAWS